MADVEKVAPDLLLAMRKAHEQLVFAENVWNGLVSIVSQQYKLTTGETIDITTGVINRLTPEEPPSKVSQRKAARH